MAGKFLVAGGEKLYVRGATYGTFARDPLGHAYPSRDVVHDDFHRMASIGLNSVRTYTVPPRWLLDEAHDAGLRVLVGIPWEQHIAFLDEPERAAGIEARVRGGVRSCAGHPALLGFALGNEIPSQVVRWTGRRRIERHIRRLYHAAKAEDPGALVTYVNYPSTEYLQLPFLDFVCFNVYLESRDTLAGYVARLHNLAGDRPLIMGELGIDSIRAGEYGQACGLESQIRTALEGGCAGGFVFSYTDEWNRGGHEIEDWAFGITTREREPKPALTTVQRAFSEVPFAADTEWPPMSVIVCAHNEERTIADCLDGLGELDYPDYEVIVVDDGSSDLTSEIASRFDVQLIRTPNQGLSRARNTGIEASRGEIIAFTDADARPDTHWLKYLAASFARSSHVGIGGPNIAPPGDGRTADCVANAPGGPIHVLLADEEAEHIPGCNMAFRRGALEAVDGFDPRFRVAGDDVDLCWRLQEQGWTLGFSPAAFVWHHPRASVRTYWRQQKGYGRAEALLEEKWPEKYNSAGHVTWGGRVYGGALSRLLAGRGRIYHGIWGAALFQTYQPANPGLLWSLASAPEWYLLLVVLTGLSLLGSVWSPLLLALPVLLLACGAVLAQAIAGAADARFTSNPRNAGERLWLSGLTALLHLLQPAARLRGRLLYGLTPWRLRTERRFTVPLPRQVFLWSETPSEPEERLELMERHLLKTRAAVLRGGPFDRWDLMVRGGGAGRVRVMACTEEHGSGRQLVRLKVWPVLSRPAMAVLALVAVLAGWATLSGAVIAALCLTLVALVTASRAQAECGGAMTAVLEAISALEQAQVIADTDKPVEIGRVA